MKRLGIDVGSYSVKLIVIDEDGRISGKLECQHYNKIKETVFDMLSGLDEDEYNLSVTGRLCKALNAPQECEIDEKTALLTGMKLVAGTKSMLYLGAEEIVYAEQEKGFLPKVCTSSKCFSGAGSFFDSLARKWNKSFDELSELSAEAKSVPMIKGRCNLLTEEIVNERLRKGIPQADVYLGCCYALAVNIKTDVLKGSKVITPVYLSGGMAKNQGVIRAIKVMLGLKDKDILFNEMSAFVVAIGCAGKAKTSIKIDEFKNNLSKIAESDTSGFGPLPKINDTEKKLDKVSLRPGEKAYLGIDVGTEYINMALLNAEKNIIYYSSVEYSGRPINTVNNELMKMHQSVHGLGRPKIAITGCGRVEADEKIHAALSINEVSAIATAGLLLCPEADTLFEIGYSKAAYLKNNGNRLVDFDMKIGCKGGIGGFFESQLFGLGLTYEEFDRLAFASKNPCDVNGYCFPAINRKVQLAVSAYKLEDVCAGIAIAIAKAFVADTDINDFEKICLLGKIANSKAIISAFSLVIGKDIIQTVYPEAFGAIGAALLLIDKKQLSFEVEINREKNARQKKEREELFLMEYDAPEKKSDRKIIGIPRILNMGRVLPFFAKTFSAFEVDILVSPSNEADIKRDSHQLATLDICYPARLVFGHVSWLIAHNVDYILLPDICSLKDNNGEECLGIACAYIQALPNIIERTFRLKEKGIKLVYGEVDLDCGRKPDIDSLLPLAEMLDIPKRKFIAAANEGYIALNDYMQRIKEVEKESIAGTEPIFVIISDYINVLEPATAIITEGLDMMGCKYTFLNNIDVTSSDHRNLYPIYITMYGCEKDIVKKNEFKRRMKGRQYLLLELDENASKLRIKSAVEAYVHTVHPQTCFMIEDQSLFKPGSLLKDMGIYNGLLSEPLEEAIGRKDYKEFFAKLLEIEKTHYNAEVKSLILGDPTRIYAEKIENSMPLSEYILFCCRENDSSRKYSGRLKAWKKMHEAAIKQNHDGIYTNIDEINASLSGRLDNKVGKSVRYRFGKLLSLSKNNIEKVLLYEYENENEALILEYLLAHHSKDIRVPYEIISREKKDC